MYHYRINDQNPLKTKRLLITPMNGKELDAMYEQEGDGALRGKIAEMRRGVNQYPELALWYTGWRITLRQSGEMVGLIAFHGSPEDKTVAIGFDILEAHRGNEYAQEAIQSLCGWAFGRENVYFIHSMTNKQNETENHIFDQLKFYRVESPIAGNIRWELERPVSSWLAIYMCIGLSIGLALGTSFYGNIMLGMIIGLSAGLALGAALDSQDRAARKRENAPEKLTEEKSEEKN